MGKRKRVIKPKPSSIKKCSKCGNTKTARAFKPKHSICNDCENIEQTEIEWQSAIRPAKVIFIDTEISPSLAWVWKNWQTNVIATAQDWFLMAVSYRWRDEDKVSVHALPDFPETYKADPTNDVELITRVHELLDSADFVVCHNTRFDVRKLNARMLLHRLPPPSPYKEICTLKIARKYFGFNSNRLDELCRQLGLGEKIEHSGSELWMDCLAGKKSAWSLMKQYCKHDTELLISLYDKIASWHSSHPNLDHFSRQGHCPICQNNHIQKRGFKRTKTTIKQTYQCQNCFHYFSDSKANSIRIVT